MKKHTMQLIYGLPVLLWTLGMITADSLKIIDFEKFGYAFFGSIVLLFVNYFFRKAPPTSP